jgi:hypothetical protein
MAEPLTWRVRLADGNPSKLAIVVLSAVLAGVVGLLLFHNLVFFGIGFIVIAASTSEVWLGIKYRLDETGATVRAGPSISAIEWAQVRRLIVNDVGVTLSPLETDSRLSAFRGVFLRAGDMGTERLVEAIGEFGGEDVRRLV